MIGSNSTFLADQKIGDDDSHDLFKLWICICSEPVEGSGWLPEADMVRMMSRRSHPNSNYVLASIQII
jgi:hypothetical protein